MAQLGYIATMLYETYSRNHNSPNNCCRDNERGAGEKSHERDFPFQTDLDLPKQGKRNREQVNVRDDIENHDNENIYTRVGWLAKVYTDGQ